MLPALSIIVFNAFAEVPMRLAAALKIAGFCVRVQLLRSSDVLCLARRRFSSASFSVRMAVSTAMITPALAYQNGQVIPTSAAFGLSFGARRREISVAMTSSIGSRFLGRVQGFQPGGGFEA